MAGPRARTLPPEGVLLRLLVAEGAWAEGLPPVPGQHDVTVSFSCVEAAAEHGDALALLGYRVVGVQALSSDVPGIRLADFLIPPLLPEEHPTWWRALADQADRAFSLALGPVLAALGEIIAQHIQPLRSPP